MIERVKFRDRGEECVVFLRDPTMVEMLSQTGTLHTSPAIQGMEVDENGRRLRRLIRPGVLHGETWHTIPTSCIVSRETLEDQP